MKKTLLLLFSAASTILSQGQTVPNGDFENWETKTYTIPNLPLTLTYTELTSWKTFNFASALGFAVPADKTSDAVSGSYAVKIQNIETTGDQGKDTLPGVIEQTFLATGSPNYLYGQYKSALPSGEQGQVVVLGVTKGLSNQTLLGYTTLTHATSTYLPFVISLSKPSIQIDSIKILISAFTYIGTQQSKYTIGGYVQVDNVSFSDMVTSEVKDLLEAGIQVSPNPSSGLVTISNKFGTVQHIEIISATGQPVFTSKAGQGEQVIDLSGQPKGLYMLYATSEDNRYSKKLVIQ